MSQLGRTQLAIARTLSDPALGNSFVAVTSQQRQSCVNMLDRGLVRRDPQDWHRYYLTDKGWRELLDYERELPAKAIGRRIRIARKHQLLQEYLEDMERLGAL